MHKSYLVEELHTFTSGPVDSLPSPVIQGVWNSKLFSLLPEKHKIESKSELFRYFHLYPMHEYLGVELDQPFACKLPGHSGRAQAVIHFSGDRYRYHCRRCNSKTGLDIVDLYQALHSVDKAEAMRQISDLVNIDCESTATSEYRRQLFFAGQFLQRQAIAEFPLAYTWLADRELIKPLLVLCQLGSRLSLAVKSYQPMFTASLKKLVQLEGTAGNYRTMGLKIHQLSEKGFVELLSDEAVPSLLLTQLRKHQQAKNFKHRTHVYHVADILLAFKKLEQSLTKAKRTQTLSKAAKLMSRGFLSEHELSCSLRGYSMAIRKEMIALAAAELMELGWTRRALTKKLAEQFGLRYQAFTYCFVQEAKLHEHANRCPAVPSVQESNAGTAGDCVLRPRVVRQPLLSGGSVFPAAGIAGPAGDRTQVRKEQTAGADPGKNRIPGADRIPAASYRPDHAKAGSLRYESGVTHGRVPGVVQRQADWSIQKISDRTIHVSEQLAGDQAKHGLQHERRSSGAICGSNQAMGCYSRSRAD